MQSLYKVLEIEAGIKWVNDIFVGNEGLWHPDEANVDIQTGCGNTILV